MEEHARRPTRNHTAAWIAGVGGVLAWFALFHLAARSIPVGGLLVALPVVCGAALAAGRWHAGAPAPLRRAAAWTGAAEGNAGARHRRLALVAGGLAAVALAGVVGLGAFRGKTAECQSKAAYFAEAGSQVDSNTPAADLVRQLRARLEVAKGAALDCDAVGLSKEGQTVRGAYTVLSRQLVATEKQAVAARPDAPLDQSPEGKLASPRPPAAPAAPDAGAEARTVSLELGVGASGARLLETIALRYGVGARKVGDQAANAALTCEQQAAVAFDPRQAVATVNGALTFVEGVSRTDTARQVMPLTDAFVTYVLRGCPR